VAPQAIYAPDGTALDATFSVDPSDGSVALIVESRGGTRGHTDARNQDYARGFELLLRRLKDRGATITDASVESKVTQHLPAADKRLEVASKPYPIVIDDPHDLMLRLGSAQARVGREPGAKGSGNRTKRVRLVLGFSGPPPSAAALEAELAGADGGGCSTVAAGTPRSIATAADGGGCSTVAAGTPRSIATATGLVGRRYANVGKLSRCEERVPFEVDPDKVDRGNQAHADTQDGLAAFLRSNGIEPVSPANTEPEFDLAWRTGDATFVAEVKSITDGNEERQLRLGLGQVLRYRQALSLPGGRVIAVLVPEREPTDESWKYLCSEVGVVLVWPESFGMLLDAFVR
jgi:hypothetical protein